MIFVCHIMHDSTKYMEIYFFSFLILQLKIKVCEICHVMQERIYHKRSTNGQAYYLSCSA